MSTPDLVQILKFTISGNPSDQKAALEFLQQACETNYVEFVRQLASVLCATEQEPFVRQAAGLQLKNTLVTKENATAELLRTRWLSMTFDVREYVRNATIKTLGTEGSRPSTAAQCIAAIACIELPANQWNELVALLVGNVTAQVSSESLREASLETLGYICQDMPSSVMERSTNEILTAIVHGMRDEETSVHVRLAGANALLNSLEFARGNFEKENERNHIMTVVCNNTQSKDNGVRVVALQCLVRIMSLYYRFLEPYIGALFQISVLAMKDQNDDVSLQGIEFWSNVCDEELDLAELADEAKSKGEAPEHVSRYYALGALPHILPTLTDALAKQESDVNDDEWLPAKAAGVCIMQLAQCCGDAIIDPILPFITSHFTNQDWHYREAAIMAFGCILEGPSKTNLERLVDQAIQPLIITLTDSHIAVKDTAAWAIGRACDACEKVVSRPEVLQTLLPALFVALQDVPRVASNVCWAISSLVRAAYQVSVNQGTDDSNTPETFVLTSVLQNMVNELIKTTERTDSASNNLRIAAYESLMELIKNSPQDCYSVVQSTTATVLSKLNSLLSVEDAVFSAQDRVQLRDLQSQLCAMLQSVLHKLKIEDAPMISDAIMAGLTQILNRCQNSKESGPVIEEALMAIGSLINLLRENFSKYMEGFKPYLFAALDNHQDEAVCIAAIGTVSDLCRIFEGKIFPIMDDVMQRLLGILQDPRAMRAVRAQVLSTFGDVALALNSEFARYIDVVMRFLQDAVQAAQVTNPEDFAQVDYAELLRDSCCTAFSGIVQAFSSGLGLDGQSQAPTQEQMQLNQANGLVYLQKHAQPILMLVSQVSSSIPSASDTLVINTCALVGDLVRAFGPPFLPILETHEIGIPRLFHRCKKTKSSKAKTICRYAEQEIQRMKRRAAPSA